MTLSATIHGLTVGRHSTLWAPRRSAGLLAVLIRQFTRMAVIIVCGGGFAPRQSPMKRKSRLGRKVAAETIEPLFLEIWKIEVDTGYGKRYAP